MESIPKPHRPKAVLIAVGIICFCLSVFLVKTLLLAPATFDNILVDLSLALTIFLIFRIFVGNNWARIILLVLYVIDIPLALMVIPNEIAKSPLSAGIKITLIALQWYAIFLLFTKPGSCWFHKAKIS